MDRLLLPLERRADRRRAGPRRRAPARSSRWPTRPTPGGRREQTWRFPARTECLVCHSRAAGFVLGFTPLQLDRDHDYGGTVDNQLRTLEHIGVFQGTLPARRDDRPRLVDPYDAKAPLEARVKSYLHVNCSTCHVKEGGGNARMELGLDHPDRQDAADRRGPRSTTGSTSPTPASSPPARPSAPCSTSGSRAGGPARCRPLVSTEVDRKAVELIGDWIRGLPPSPTR